MRIWILLAIAVSFAITIYIGYWAGKKSKTLTDFYIGGRNIGLWLTVFTYVATWNSAVTYLGIPGLAYTYGLGLIGLCIVGSAGPGLVGFYLMAKRLRVQTLRLNALTVPDYVEARYQSKNTRIVATISILLFSTIYLVAQFMGISYLWEVLIGIPFHYGLIIYAIIVAVYTAIGGYYSVVYTDLFQGIVMTLTAIAVIPYACSQFGGWTRLHQLGAQAMGAKFNAVPGLFPTFFWITITFYCLGSLGSPQLHQRLFSLKGWSVIKWGGLLTAVIAFIQTFSMMYGGYAARVAEFTGMIPKGAITAADRAMANYLLYGWPGYAMVIFVVGVMCASMSTADSLLLVCSQALGRDLFQKLLRKNLDDKATIMITKYSIFLIAFLAVLGAWRTSQFIVVVSAMQLTVIGGTFMPTVIFGCWWRGGTKEGALASMIGGLICGVSFYTFLKPYIPEPFFPTIIVSFALFIIVSKLTKPPAKELMDKLFAPIRHEEIA